MHLKLNESDIRVHFPVDSISINNKAIVYTDKQGQNKRTFASRADALRFMRWLINASHK